MGDYKGEYCRGWDPRSLDCMAHITGLSIIHDNWEGSQLLKKKGP